MVMLHFDYKMKIEYEEPVGRCYFTIKCMPREDARQHVPETKISIFPETEKIPLAISKSMAARRNLTDNLFCIRLAM